MRWSASGWLAQPGSTCQCTPGVSEAFPVVATAQSGCRPLFIDIRGGLSISHDARRTLGYAANRDHPMVRIWIPPPHSSWRRGLACSGTTPLRECRRFFVSHQNLMNLIDWSPDVAHSAT